MAKDDKTEAMTYDEEDVSEGEQPVYEMQYESD